MPIAIVLLLGGVALLALPSVGRSTGSRLVPAEWARLCWVALAGGAISFELGVILLAAPTLLEATGVHALEAVCDRLAGPFAPSGDIAGWAVVCAAVILPVRVLRAARTARRSCRGLWIEHWLGEHVRARGFELVVLPTDEIVAISIDGPTSQIVVSHGLQALLSPDQFAAVVRHEAAHLRHHHQRMLVLTASIENGFRFLPPVGRSTSVLRTALERSADECAAGNQRTTRIALRDALLAVARTKVGPAVAGFSARGAVIERLAALEQDPPRPPALPHLLAYVPGAALAAGLAIGTIGWVFQAQVVMAMAGSCPV